MVFATSWSTIVAAQTDADSPLDVVLMESIRQNLIHVYEWIGQGYTPSTAHNHNNINSANVILGVNAVNTSAVVNSAITSTKISATAVEPSHLKLAQGSFTSDGGGGSSVYVSINRYALWPRSRMTNCSTGEFMELTGGYKIPIGTPTTDTGQLDSIRLTASLASGIAHVYWDYHTS